jgi:hypothetical protein
MEINQIIIIKKIINKMFLFNIKLIKIIYNIILKAFVVFYNISHSISGLDVWNIL